MVAILDFGLSFSIWWRSFLANVTQNIIPIHLKLSNLLQYQISSSSHPEFWFSIQNLICNVFPCSPIHLKWQAPRKALNRCGLSHKASIKVKTKKVTALRGMEKVLSLSQLLCQKQVCAHKRRQLKNLFPLYWCVIQCCLVNVRAKSFGCSESLSKIIFISTPVCPFYSAAHE